MDPQNQMLLEINLDIQDVVKKIHHSKHPYKFYHLNQNDVLIWIFLSFLLFNEIVDFFMDHILKLIFT